MPVPRIVLLAVLAASFAVEAQMPRPSAPDPRSGLIVGQVVDADSGKPIGDAVVSGPSRTQILTGPDGRFVFRDLPKGPYGVMAIKPGYADGAYGRRRPGGPSQQVTLNEGERVGDVVVRMWKHGAVSGTVVDEVGEPIVGVEVAAFRRTIVAGLQRFVSSGGGGTDDRGIYRISNLSPGDYIVGISPRAVAVPVALGNRIVGSGNAVVRMQSPPGTPYAMELDGIAYSLGRGMPIPRPPAGGRLFVYPSVFYSSTIVASHASVMTLRSGEDRSAIDFQISPVPTMRVSGVVLGPDGEMAAVPLRLFDRDARSIGLNTESASAATDGYGRFMFPAVPEGNYVLQTAAPDSAPARPGGTGGGVLWADLPVTVGRDNVEGLVVNLQRGLRISGHFEFEGTLARPQGRMLESVPLSIEPADAGSAFVMPNVNARADAGGQFTTSGIPAGRYFVRVLGSPVGWMFKSASYGGRDVSDLPLDLQSIDANGVVITFTDRWTGVRGTVTMPPRRSTDAIVLLFPTDPQFWTNYGTSARRIKSAKAGRTGEYVINSVPVGSYYIVALPDEQAGDWQDPKFLQAVVGAATHITITDGEKRVQNLQLRELR